ncbi:MAG: hypothetical protein K0Q77_3150 [Anaerosporomusa subterranea]|jgi:hypothetical protein|nr:hypothetical protein [Anaerosporomusa subterranea]
MRADIDNNASKHPIHSGKEEMDRMIIAPQDAEGNTAVTLIRNGIKKSSIMEFDVALEKLFTLKVTYFTGRADHSPK